VRDHGGKLHCQRGSYSRNAVGIADAAKIMLN
jgi:hypothetical protein